MNGDLFISMTYSNRYIRLLMKDYEIKGHKEGFRFKNWQLDIQVVYCLGIQISD